MRKAGGTIALIAGILAVFATLFSSLLALLAFPFAPSDLNPVSILVGGLFVSATTIVLGSLIIHTRNAWYSAALTLMSLAGILYGLGGGLVMLCTALALIGGIVSGFEPKQDATREP